MFTTVTLTLFLLALQSAPATAHETEPKPAAPRESEINLSRYFAGFDACFVVLDVSENTIRRYNPRRCGERFAPCSTFKVPHSVIAIDLGVLSGADHKRKWDGVQRWNEAWNRDHDLRSAIRDSVVWYFQQTAKEIGPERMKTALVKLNYGNMDCSGPIDEFWLGGPLAISANEQLAFMNKLRLADLPLAKRAQEITSDLIVVDRAADRILRGKTGTGGQNGQATLGWFVGWLEAGERTLVFAVNMSAEQGALGPKTRDITRAILADLLPEKPKPPTDKPR
jgi:beta-lactamase class D